ncbi:MAG: hypothetical protein IPP35_04370 [Elusimicrobia bacterium]|nr:hypothetical protein [Elusimicrobiota bacterium]
MSRSGCWPLAAVLLLAAKTPDYFNDCLKDAGGGVRYDRVETVDWSFSMARPSPGGVVTWRGRQRLRRAGNGFQIREDLETPEGRWTVWTGSAPFVLKDGIPVSDPATRDARVSDARLRVFWLMAPFTLSASSSGSRYLGSAYFQTRLVRRIELDLKPDQGIPVDAPVVLLLDTDVPRLRGVRFGANDGAGSFLLEDHELRQNLLNTAAQWTRFNAAGQRMEVLRANAVVYNSYLDDAVFAASTHEDPQGETLK